MAANRSCGKRPRRCELFGGPCDGRWLGIKNPARIHSVSVPRQVVYPSGRKRIKYAIYHQIRLYSGKRRFRYLYVFKDINLSRIATPMSS